MELKTIATYGLFGRLDAVLTWEAPDEARAMKFKTGVQDVLQTETFLAIPPQVPRV